MILCMIFTSFFLPFACLVTWHTGPRLIVNPDVEPLVGLVARRNAMKLMIGCVIPLQVRVRVGIKLDAAYTRGMKF